MTRGAVSLKTALPHFFSGEADPCSLLSPLFGLLAAVGHQAMIGGSVSVRLGETLLFSFASRARHLFAGYRWPHHCRFSIRAESGSVLACLMQGTLFPFQPHDMKERIRRLLRWLDRRLIGDGKTFPLYRSTDGAVNVVKDPKRGELIFASFLETAPASAIVEKELFQVTILRGSSSDESPCYYLDMRFLNEDWIPLLMIHESKLPVIQSALQDVSDFIEKNPAHRKS